MKTPKEQRPARKAYRVELQHAREELRSAIKPVRHLLSVARVAYKATKVEARKTYDEIKNRADLALIEALDNLPKT